MKLSSGMILTFGRRGDRVWMNTVDEHGPSTFGGGSDTIYIPAYDINEVIAELQRHRDDMEAEGLNV